MKLGLKKELAVLCALGAVLALGRKRKWPTLALAMTAGALLGWRRDENSFHRQSVVITGGSRGLGLALAQILAEEGAQLTLLARDGEELARAREQLEVKFPHIPILAVVCDVTQPDQVKQAFAQAQAEFGGIDMLINNAGAIMVGPYDQMLREDFEAQMELHFYGAMNAINQALPYLRLSTGRRIVNICSIGGMVGVPHMLPYDVSKFALSGYSQGLDAELAHERISVTAVYPTLMRTGSPIQAVFKGDHEKEFAWFAAGDVLPGLSTSPLRAARAIIEGARARKAKVVPSWIGRVGVLGMSLFPEIASTVIRLVASTLPRGQSTYAKTGAQSRALFDRSPWTSGLRASTRQAEEAFNQQPKDDAEFNMGLKH